MKTYELWLHGKQGDDFARHLSEKKTPVGALMAWAQAFRERATACEALASALDGLEVEVLADTHSVSFTPWDTKASRALKALAKQGALQVMTEEDMGLGD